MGCYASGSKPPNSKLLVSKTRYKVTCDSWGDQAPSVPGSGGIFRIKAFVSEGVLRSISIEGKSRGFVLLFICLFSINREVNLGMDFITANFLGSGLFFAISIQSGLFFQFRVFFGLFLQFTLKSSGVSCVFYAWHKSKRVISGAANFFKTHPWDRSFLWSLNYGIMLCCNLSVVDGNRSLFRFVIYVWLHNLIA